MRPGSDARRLAVDLAWSLWRELGVPGPVRRHQGWLVVPEPLIVFTAALGDGDRRLRDNALAWCVTHRSLVSTRALSNTFTHEGWHTEHLADFAATLHAEAGGRWPAADLGRPFSVSGHGEGFPPPFTERSQLALRLRALLGVGVRAEVVRVVLTGPARPHTLTDLAWQVMATKRQTTDAVEQLEWSGILRVERSRQPHQVHLVAHDQIAALLAPIPEIAPSWGPLLRLLHAAVGTLDDTAALPPTLAAAQLHRTVRDLDDQRLRLHLPPPDHSPGEDPVDHLGGWLHELLATVAHGRALEA
jgi:hypothetical protein